MEIYVYFMPLITTIVGMPLIIRILEYSGMKKKNWRNHYVLYPSGIVLLMAGVNCLVTGWVLNIFEYRYYLSGILIYIGFGSAGFIDDIFGNNKYKGFKGHIKALLSYGKITTGFIKILAGLSISLCIGFYYEVGLIGPLLTALIIALCANTMNLLDTKPVRVLKGFGTLFLMLLLIVPINNTLALPMALFVALIWHGIYEAKEKVMMGDTGSNIAGAIIGFWVAVNLPVLTKSIFLLVLFGLNVLSEKISFSQYIENNVFLKAIDDIGRHK